jgi:hypothetical protein
MRLGLSLQCRAGSRCRSCYVWPITGLEHAKPGATKLRTRPLVTDSTDDPSCERYTLIS